MSCFSSLFSGYLRKRIRYIVVTVLCDLKRLNTCLLSNITLKEVHLQSLQTVVDFLKLLFEPPEVFLLLIHLLVLVGSPDCDINIISVVTFRINSLPSKIYFLKCINLSLFQTREVSLFNMFMFSAPGFLHVLCL